MIASKEWIGERLVIHFCGTFDPAAEWEFHCVLAEATADRPVTAVFSQVLDFHDIALAMLARDLAQCTGGVELVGLRHHQLSILRYFGIAGVPGRRPAPEDS